MACQVLHSLGVNRSIDKICDVRVAELMRRDLEIQAIYHIAVMSCLLAQDRCYCIQFELEIFV